MQRALILAGGLIALALLTWLCAYPKIAPEIVPVGEMAVSSGTAAPALRISRAGEGWSIDAHVASAAERDRIAAASAGLGAAAGSPSVAVDAAAPASWAGSVAALVGDLGGIGSAKLAIEGGHASIDGVVDTEQAKVERAAGLQRELGPAIELANRLRVVSSADRVVTSIRSIIAGRVVEFEIASATLAPAGRALLDELIGPIQSEPGARFAVEGHTDSSGDPAFNRDLSRQRAEAVRTYLVEHGVDAARIEARGRGADQPIADNATAEGRLRNRRVEFTALQ
jgi:OmpA-OmpF porin, OOP family